MEIAVTSSDAGQGVPVRVPRERVPASELARRQGVRPIKSADDLVCEGLWDSDEEFLEFLAHIHAMRRAEMPDL